MSTCPGSAVGPAFSRRWVGLPLLLASALASVGCQPAAPERSARMVRADNPVEAGRYIINIGGCNDCHTDGFMEAGFAIPEDERLTGSMFGFNGPWGTTYPPNLRLTVQKMTEDQWVEMLGTRNGLPPMPWPSVNAMSEVDRRAVYQYLRSLGPKGEVRTAALAPGAPPVGGWFDFTPQGLEIVASAGN